MRTLPWDRGEQVRRIRSQIWRHLSAAAEGQSPLRLDAAALLQLSEGDVRLLADVHFVLSDEVKRLLDDLPGLMRRLATTTVAEEETSAERIRGAVNWGRTIGARMSTGVPHVYVTTPARRAHQTPENELLMTVLDEIVERGRRLGLAQGRGIGREIAARVGVADEYRHRRALGEVRLVPPTARSLARVRTGRHRGRYESALAAFGCLLKLVKQLDEGAIRDAIEREALVTRDDPTLFEISGTFGVLDALERDGWSLPPLRLFGSGPGRALRLRGRRDRERLDLWYQHAPRDLTEGSDYVRTQRRHRFLAIQPLRPDLVMRHHIEGASPRWVLGEIKLGTRREVQASAREALVDLLAYRRDFRAQLDHQSGPFGLGLAWGAELDPAASTEIVLCTPDRLNTAVRHILGSGHPSS